ncbi:hypothetical protein LZ575_12950 [Antarcticibacterium sp. 1MA-6-2]|uniref:hypothetical protein n=1 Tax=Antarcticibacterium sp. 1MA-6-2 TaxID=2908210 RepID=UPI001F1B4279|nr:hypothetical protein [Antarcticibacterium sp. 1MA-6-2]UJH89896.1 hypothetical protein LZ575_12950 [Antarcticibacterium sp. 1MA-6-2]
MKSLLLALMFPLMATAQFEPDQYFTIQTEIDARNAIFGGTVNEKGYNGVWKAGFSAQWFRADVFYETFRDLKYKTAGLNLTHIFHYKRAFKQGLGVQMSLIDKPKKLTPSIGLNAILEYHLGMFFVTARAERKVRTDWDIVVNSGFVGMGVKI